MKTSLALAVAAIVASASAQTLSSNKRSIWDQTTEYTSRANVGSNAGYISQAVPFGAIAGAKTLTSASYLVQDQNMATVEPWDFLWTSLDPKGSGNPDYAGGKVIVANNRLSVGTGVGAWAITHTLTAPANAVKIAVPRGRLIFAWHLKTKTNWSKDGISLHMSQADTGLPNSANTPQCYTASSRSYHREMNRVEGTAIIPGNKLAQSSGLNNTFSDLHRSWRFDMGWDEVTLNTGVENAVYNGTCSNPNYGYGGFDPDVNNVGKQQVKREDNLVWQVQAGAQNAGSVAFLFSSMAMLNKGIATPFGEFWLNPGADPLFSSLGALPFSAPLDAKGVATFTLTIPKAVRPLVASFPCWSAQALVFNAKSARARFSTAATMRFFYDPKLAKQTAWTQGKATAKVAHKIQRPAVGIPLSLFLRNDGPGVLEVDEYRLTHKLRTFLVNERTAVRERTNPGGTEWRVRGKHAKPTTFVYRWNY